MLVRVDFTSLCHNLSSYQFPASETINLNFLSKSQSQSTSTLFQLASQSSSYSLCYCTFWAISFFFKNRNKQLFLKMMVGFTIGTEKIYAHTDTVCSSRELSSQANSYWKKTQTTRRKKKNSNKTKMSFAPGKKYHHSFCKAILYYFRC